VLRALSLLHAAAITPVQALVVILALFTPDAVSALPPIRVGSACTSNLSGLARPFHLAFAPAITRAGHQLYSLIEVFSHFDYQSPMPVPIAPAEATIAGWASHPLKRRHFHGARRFTAVRTPTGPTVKSDR